MDGAAAVNPEDDEEITIQFPPKLPEMTEEERDERIKFLEQKISRLWPLCDFKNYKRYYPKLEILDHRPPGWPAPSPSGRPPPSPSQPQAGCSRFESRGYEGAKTKNNMCKWDTEDAVNDFVTKLVLADVEIEREEREEKAAKAAGRRRRNSLGAIVPHDVDNPRRSDRIMRRSGNREQANRNSSNAAVTQGESMEVEERVDLSKKSSENTRVAKKDNGQRRRSNSSARRRSNSANAGQATPQQLTRIETGMVSAGVYKVERIVDSRFNNSLKKFEYRVKWEEWNWETNTWETEDQFSDYFLIDLFWQKTFERTTELNIVIEDTSDPIEDEGYFLKNVDCKLINY